MTAVRGRWLTTRPSWAVDWPQIAERWAWPALFGMAAALRLWRLGAAEVWYDEAFTLRLAQLPIARLIAATAGDTHPPLYYLLVWLTGAVLGHAEWAVRLPSVAASLWGLYLARRLAEALGLGRATVYAGALLMALAPFQLHYAQEARQYALLQALVLLGLLAAVERRWVLLACAEAAALWVHNYGLFYLVPINLLAVASIVRIEWRYATALTLGLDEAIPAGLVATLRHRLVRRWVMKFGTRRAMRLALATGAALLAYAPWAVYGLAGQMRELGELGWWGQPPTIGSVLHTFYVLTWGFGIPAWAQSHAALALFLLLGLAAVRLYRARSWPAGALLVTALATPAIAFAFSYLWRPVWLHRALIGSAPPLYLLMAWAATDRLSLARRAWAAVLLLPVLALGVWSYYGQVAADKSTTGPAVRHIREHWLPGDVVVHANPSGAVLFHLYAPDLPGWLLPVAGHTAGGYSAATRAALGLVESRMDRTPLPWSRAWLVWGTGPTNPPQEEYMVNQVIAQYRGTNVLMWRDDALARAGLWLLDKGH